MLFRETVICCLFACIATADVAAANDANKLQHIVFNDISFTPIDTAHESSRSTSRKHAAHEFVLSANGQVIRASETNHPDARHGHQNGAGFEKQFSIKASTDVAGPDHDRKANTNLFGGHHSSVFTGAPACSAGRMPPARIKALVIESARRHDVDETLAVAVAWVESRFGRKVNSPKGARGPMQLMPATAKRFHVDDICDPRSNIDGGVTYLRRLSDRFKNPLLVAAAYNAGADHVYEYGGIPPFRETENYVARVINHMLGLAMPEGATGASDASITQDQPTGVIKTSETGRFVGGVMHF